MCGLLLLWSSETGFWVSDDLFADAFRGQSPRYGRFQTTFGIGADSWAKPTLRLFFRRPFGLARIRGENPRHSRFQTTFAVSAPAVRCV
ncbi:hypothetical protein [Neisseria sicca]|uniref:hypothetical protein n=1 Tax=Neisseria sicca TaxID=490 RepID=UPI002880316E|nr:hypothetical protein [Neisseria sicca]